MKKKIYLKPAIKVAGNLSLQLMETTPGWTKDGNPPYRVYQEDEVKDLDKLLPSGTNVWGDGEDHYGGFLDLD